ncbi:hypothetical protein Ahy_B04g072255 [Arachis hypogaea]|uniref:Uncharacterized protein n=1 Tax=Arachis hypogaea TaxID=3818 RepID=A0A444ZMS0_ARAHY|nr:hypothetical protein Ahy_B04g072255 [Arachis hypogaea]
MARKGLYKKKPKLGPGCQQSQMALPPASASHCDESQTLPDSGDSVPATSRPFLLPRNVSMPAPQTSTNSVQNSESGHVNLAANANDVDSLDQEADDPFVEIIGSDYGKFSISRESLHKITTKDKVYNECVKQIFHFDEDGDGTIKKNILKSMGRSWKETRLRLYNDFYKPIFTIEQNIEHRPLKIDREHWRSFLDYRAKDETKSIVSKWFHCSDFRKRETSRVRGVGFRLTPSQLFGPNSHTPGTGVQLEEMQRKLIELQEELEGEKLKKKAMEDEAAAGKKKMKPMESALIFLFQWQGKELPPDITTGMSFVE